MRTHRGRRLMTGRSPRVCPICSGIRCPMPSCSPSPSKANSATRRCSRSRSQRLLADARSQRFTDSFATQWLRLKKVGMFQPDKNLYPDYDKALESSMVGETKAFFREVLSSGLTLREFLHSDWSMLNPRLAQFYGLPEAAGQRRRVPARLFARRQPSRRLAHAGGDSLAHQRWHAASPRASRRVGHGVDLRQIAAAAAGKRESDSHEPDRPEGHAAAEARSAHPRRQLCCLPRQDRSARPGLRELRRHRPLAHRGSRPTASARIRRSPPRESSPMVATIRPPMNSRSCSSRISTPSITPSSRSSPPMPCAAACRSTTAMT